MNQPRETVMTALFDQLCTINGFRTKSRRLKLWTDMATEEFPALFLMDWTEDHVHQGEGLPVKTTLNTMVYMYTKVTEEAEGFIPGTELNTLLDKLDAAIAPNPLSGKQTLNGTVSHVWVEGEVLKFPGDLDGEGIIIVPVRVLVP